MYKVSYKKGNEKGSERCETYSEAIECVKRLKSKGYSARKVFYYTIIYASLDDDAVDMEYIEETVSLKKILEIQRKLEKKNYSTFIPELEEEEYKRESLY